MTSTNVECTKEAYIKIQAFLTMSQIQQREEKGRAERGEKRGEEGKKRGRKDSSRFQRSGGQQGAAAPVGDAARHPHLHSTSYIQISNATASPIHFWLPFLLLSQGSSFTTNFAPLYPAKAILHLLVAKPNYLRIYIYTLTHLHLHM